MQEVRQIVQNPRQPNAPREVRVRQAAGFLLLAVQLPHLLQVHDAEAPDGLPTATRRDYGKVVPVSRRLNKLCVCVCSACVFGKIYRDIGGYSDVSCKK